MTLPSIRHPNSPTAVEQLSTPTDVVSERIEFDKDFERWSRTPVGFQRATTPRFAGFLVTLGEKRRAC